MLSTFDRRIKKIISNREVLPDEQLNKTIQRYQDGQGQDGMSLAEFLIEQGQIDSEQLISQVALEMNIPPVDLERINPDEAALEEIGEDIAREYTIAPVSKIGRQLTVAVANPFNLQKLDNLRLTTGCDIRPMVSTRRQIQEAIGRYFGEESTDELMDQLMDDDEESVELKEDEEQKDEYDLSNLKQKSEDSKVVQLVNSIIKKALDEGVSDIHIEPWESKIRVRYRKDGVLSTALDAPKRMHAAMVSRIKIMSQMDIAERRAPQDGKFQMKYQGRKIDFRVSVYLRSTGRRS